MRNIRAILAGLVGLGIIVLLVVLIIKGLSGGGSPASPKAVDLSKYASTDATSELYIDAPTNIDQDHRTVHIIVGQDQTQIDIIQGYQGNVIQTQSFPNNSAAYAAFLQSLKQLNFQKGSTNPSDERGYCSEGERYVYTLKQGGDTLFRYWSTSCGQGTFGGNRPQVRQLFEHQIPEKIFDQLTAGIPIG